MDAVIGQLSYRLDAAGRTIAVDVVLHATLDSIVSASMHGSESAQQSSFSEGWNERTVTEHAAKRFAANGVWAWCAVYDDGLPHAVHIIVDPYYQTPRETLVRVVKVLAHEIDHVFVLSKAVSIGKKYSDEDRANYVGSISGHAADIAHDVIAYAHRHGNRLQKRRM